MSFVRVGFIVYFVRCLILYNIVGWIVVGVIMKMNLKKINGNGLKFK